MQKPRVQRRPTTQKPLSMILVNTPLCESDGEEIKIENSDSSDEETCTPLPEPRALVEHGRTEVAKDGTVWRVEQLAKPLFTPVEPYTADGAPTAKTRRIVTSRLQSFLCFISLQMLRMIQRWTVQHGRHKEHENWFMDVPELMGFIAVLIWKGVTQVPSLCDNWSEDMGNPRIIATMARNRFQNIMQHLRFDDMYTRAERVQTDKFAAISTVWESFVKNCISVFTPGRHITIDEQLFPSKTQCGFLQYIATKPDKFGIKFWVACDLKSKYICNAIPYLGKDPNRPSGERLSESVVMKLMEPFLDKGRTVTTDNFFTSLSLAQRLRSRRTSLLGTVNKIRREIPPSTRQGNQIDFTTRVFSTPEAILTVYAPKRKKTVYILSSMHSQVETEDSYKQKPNTVTQYNQTKCGVDVMDQMVREYTVRSGTRRWPIAVFYNMIDMAALNAHIVYQACTGVQERRAEFLVHLAKELAKFHINAKKSREDKKFLQQPLSTGKRTKCQVRDGCKRNSAAGRCVHCFKYTCGKCKKEPALECRPCSDSQDKLRNR
ncbi:piggyBac transposable element-derived protein 4-like [Corythoichthys intestinalis]|uniref:piggyBac transposable element-derived protein 4-like n=1 Tax=Corythoichthys intestinalis TaxID=161448 RepID=UPI0025A54624|nr:piggyBac transposable element-derived protein 4-like [Corythoichthys intestinalis]